MSRFIEVFANVKNVHDNIIEFEKMFTKQKRKRRRKKNKVRKKEKKIKKSKYK